MVNEVLSINDVINSLDSNPPVSDILNLIIDNEVGCFVKCPQEYKVYAEGNVVVVPDVIQRRITGPVNEIGNPVEVVDVRYLKVSDSDIKDLLLMPSVEVSMFYQVLVGNLLKVKSRLFECSKFFFIAPVFNKIPNVGVYSFSHRLEVRASDLYVMAFDLEKLKGAYFSKFSLGRLLVKNHYVTKLNLCAYEYYKNDLQRKYVKGDVVSLMTDKSIGNIEMTKDDASHFSAVINREERSWKRVGEESGEVFTEKDLPIDVLAWKRHESFTVKLTVINYLCHALKNNLITRKTADDQLAKYGFKKILAGKVLKFLQPSSIKKDGCH